MRVRPSFPTMPAPDAPADAWSRPVGALAPPHPSTGDRGARAGDAMMERQATTLAQRIRSAVVPDHVGIAVVEPDDRRLRVRAATGGGGRALARDATLWIGSQARAAIAEERIWSTSAPGAARERLALQCRRNQLATALLVPFTSEVPGGVVLLGWTRWRTVPDDAVSRVRAVLDQDQGLWSCLLLAERERRRAQWLDQRLHEQEEAVELLAHDMATPVGVISGLSRLVRDRRGDPADASRWVEAIARNAGFLETLVGNLRDLIQLDRGAMVASGRPVELGTLCREVVDDMRGASGRDIRLAAEPVTALGDSQMLRRILYNLLSNAQKYSPSSTPVQVTVSEADDRACVRVLDHGPGIPGEAYSQVLQPFSRLQRDERSGVPGTGLGLYIVQGLVEAQSGSLVLDSHQGRGTSLTVRLPLAPCRTPD